MSYQHFTEPPSILARKKEGDGPKKQTREEYRKQKELEELRKAGNAPAEVDESGKDINPHIPKYMVDVPWYVTYDHSKPTLKHQRTQDDKMVLFDGLDKWYNRTAAQQQVKMAIKFREGACENCGAMGHKRKECLEKPRKRLAKYGAGVIAPDDLQQPELKLSFEGKRDRWNGVDMDDYQGRVHVEFEKLEEARRQIKAKKLDEEADAVNEAATAAAASEEAAPAAATTTKQTKTDSDEDSDDEYKYADEMNPSGQKLHLESKQRISVRNLRMREDTAKYLLNLDPNSAYYDPKSRSMRSNPFADKPDTQTPYVGDNFVRYSGEANKFAKSQLFAWEADEKGFDLHQQAEPTKLELLHKDFKQRHEEIAKGVKANILDKYGGAEHLQAPPKELIYGQTSGYVEYDRMGNVVLTSASDKKPVVRSKYIEDLHPMNHTSVWGSYWKNHKWGFKCCQSFDRNVACKGPVVQ
jgi:pre-mRNA-processing factor SLU7